MTIIIIKITSLPAHLLLSENYNLKINIVTAGHPCKIIYFTQHIREDLKIEIEMGFKVFHATI